jgi:PAS domain S-box-containing protein
LAKVIHFNRRKTKAVSKRGSLPAERSVAVFNTDAGGQYVFVNRNWSRLAGVSQLAALGQGWIESVHPDDRDEVLKSWAGAVQGEQYFGLMYRLQGSRREPRLVLSQAIPHHDDNGEMMGYCGTVLDLSQFSCSQKTPELERRFTTILDMLGVSYYEHDLVTGEISCSPSCAELIGDVRTKHEFDALLHPEDLPRVDQLFSHSISDGMLFEAEYRVVGRDGEWNRIRVYAKIFFTIDGAPCFAVGFLAPVESFLSSQDKQGLSLLCRLSF